jgi:uncharacterized protein (DUF1684 family)
MSKLDDFRKRKDTYFRSHPRSPFSAEQKKDFQGLHYFPENPDLNLTVQVERYNSPEEVQVETTTGDTQTFTRYGHFKFEVEGEEVELNIYSGGKGYFLPFKDSLAGEETYDIGRYVEVKALGNDRFEVDFNMAYNPFCAYTDGFSCLITPEENHLTVAIRAGEKVYNH